MASPSASLGPASFHPTLTLSLPPAFLKASSSSSSQCQPHLLLSLPPSLFLDPFHPSTSHFKQSARIQELLYLSATTEGNVEIEKAVGWTMDPKSVPRGKREKAKADAEEAEAQLVEKLGQTEVRFVAGEGYVTKTISSSQEGPTQVVALPNEGASSYSPGGRKKAPPNRENEAILIRLAAREDGEALASIEVPLHARYLPPVDSSSSSSAPLSLIKSVLKSSNDGNYLDVSPSAIEVFWVCPDGGSNAAPADDLSDGGAIWEKILRPSKLLPPSHVHLTSPLIDRLTPSSNKPSIHRIVNLDSTSSTTIRLPTGDAAFAGDAFTITQTVLALLAVWMFVRVRAMTKGD